MSTITGITLPPPIDWSSVKGEATDHINKLDTLMQQTISIDIKGEAFTFTYMELYYLALGEVMAELPNSERHDIANYLKNNYMFTFQNPNPLTIKDLFTAWLTFTPPPDPTTPPATFGPETGGPGFYIECWDYIVNTLTGLVLSNQEDFKTWFSQFLNYHGNWINCSDATTTLAQWKKYGGTTDHPFDIDNYEQPDPSSPTGGFLSFNQFFLRNLKPHQRPLCADDPAIVAPCDGGIFYLQKEAADSTHQTHRLIGKSNDPFNLEQALPKKYSDKLVGGPLFDILLWFTDYHHFHAPVTGDLLFQQLYPGSYNYDFNDFDPKHPEGKLPPDDSDKVGWYQKLAKHQRYVWVIDTKEFGLVAMIAIGFWGVGSIINDVENDSSVTKGQYMGHFGYGGSSIVLAFEPGKNLDFKVGGTTPIQDANHPVLMKVRECLGKQAG